MAAIALSELLSSSLAFSMASLFSFSLISDLFSFLYANNRNPTSALRCLLASLLVLSSIWKVVSSSRLSFLTTSWLSAGACWSVSLLPSAIHFSIANYAKPVDGDQNKPGGSEVVESS
jgi:hypothetical protein